MYHEAMHLAPLFPDAMWRGGNGQRPVRLCAKTLHRGRHHERDGGPGETVASGMASCLHMRAWTPAPQPETLIRREHGHGRRCRASWRSCTPYTALIFQGLEIQASLAHRKYPGARPLELQKGLRSARSSRIIALANCLTGVWAQTAPKVATILTHGVSVVMQC